MATAKRNGSITGTQVAAPQHGQAAVLHQDAEHTVYRLGDADGEVVQTVYPVFPGIEIAYNDVHATSLSLIHI